jgi:mannan endo-1,4-beta-mannosidase
MKDRTPVEAELRQRVVSAAETPPGRHRRGFLRLHSETSHDRSRLTTLGERNRDGAHRASWSRPDDRRNRLRKVAVILAVCAAIITTAVIILATVLHGKSAGARSVDPDAPTSAARPVAPGNYLGVYEPSVPASYAGVSSFTARTGVRPSVVLYYSGWLEKFQTRFAAIATRHGAVPLVQINPGGVSIQAIASGQYDSYWRSYASAIRAFGRHVIISFGHEMNGSWYSWGYRHTSSVVFVAAWRHIVTIFRREGADNVTWLWTINISVCHCHVDSPAHWWPGNSYVDWVGIDGYYYKPSWKFASLFGPTIKAVRALTLDPILISETAAPAAMQPAKIPDLFRGIRAYGLLGFVWFDVNKSRQNKDWHISSPAAFAAFHRGAEMLKRPAP